MAYIHTPHKLLDFIADDNKLKNDAAIARLLQVAPPVLSKIRNAKAEIGPSLIVRISEVFGYPVIDIKAIAEQPSLPRFVPEPPQEQSAD